MFPRGYTPEAQILIIVGLVILTIGVAIIVGTVVFPPAMPRMTPVTVAAGLIILGIGLSIAVGALVVARPSEDTRGRG